MKEEATKENPIKTKSKKKKKACKKKRKKNQVGMGDNSFFKSSVPSRNMDSFALAAVILIASFLSVTYRLIGPKCDGDCVEIAPPPLLHVGSNKHQSLRKVNRGASMGTDAEVEADAENTHNRKILNK